MINSAFGTVLGLIWASDADFYSKDATLGGETVPRMSNSLFISVMNAASLFVPFVICSVRYLLLSLMFLAKVVFHTTASDTMKSGEAG